MIKTLLKQGILAGAFSVLCAHSAVAATCKEPDIVIHNDTSHTVNVTSFQYLDGCDTGSGEEKWRNEEVNNTEIKSGKSKTFRDNLEYVEGCTIRKIKVTYTVDVADDFKAGITKSKTVSVDEDQTNRECTKGKNFDYHMKD